MAKSKRVRIPKQIKDYVRSRQKGKCACCIDRGDEFHHVKPSCLGGSSITANNIVLLCEFHHKILHLGDLDTCLTILEYVFYLNHKILPVDLDELRELSLEIMRD